MEHKLPQSTSNIKVVNLNLHSRFENIITMKRMEQKLPQSNIDLNKTQLDQGARPKPNDGAQTEKTPSEDSDISFREMLRFADKYDSIMMLIGTIGGLGLGGCTPVFILFWGQFTNVFNSSPDIIVNEALQQLYKFIYLGIGTFFLGWVMITCWLITGQRQAVACRKAYFSCLLKQQIGWFDCINQCQLSCSFSSDTMTYQGALGQKMALILQAIGTTIGGFVVAFTQGWLMTFVCLACFPLIAFAAILFMRTLQFKAKDFQKIYATAGGQAEQSFFSIKTVKQLNGQQYQHKTFLDLLAGVKKQNLKFGIKIAASFGMVHGAIFLLYSLGFWFGSNCVEGNSHCPPSISGGIYSPGDVLTVFFSLMMACIYLSQLAPALKKIGEGKQAAARIYKVLDRQPTIKNPQNGLKPEHFEGRIRFQHVTFAYPKDLKKKVLDNISIEFDINNTALVGQSGCGKSTILQLIMRFYDPLQGRILFDGIDIRELDLVWLRNKIGYVGQEPVLFAASILENLRLGNENASDEEIDEALKQAEAYDFIYDLEKQLDTYVGSGGGQISGGQKQRIAIARALLKKPKILLLDEATSALDRKNEKLIQNTLNKISQGLTTVTVAHRVNTIMSADIIYVIEQGQILKKGRFKELERYKDHKQVDEKEQLLANEQKKLQHKKGRFSKVSSEVTSRRNNQIKEELQVDQRKKKQAQENKKLIQKHEKGIYKRIFSYLQFHRISFAIGILLTICLGLIYPIFSIFLSSIINALFYLQIPATNQQGRHDSNVAALIFLILAAGMFLIACCRDFLTYVVGNDITSGIRNQTYQKILKMPVYWFDKPQNNCGILSTRLGTDCQTINGMCTTYIYILIQCSSTLIAGVIISFVYQWRTALVAISSLPLIMLSGYIKSRFRTGFLEKTDQTYKDSAQIVMESLTNIRTVVSFGVQNTVLHKYQRYLDKPLKDVKYNSIVPGFFFGLSQIVNFIVFGLLFYIGAIFMQNYGVSLLNVFTAIYSIFFAGITIGNNTNFLPDINQAKLAASHIFEILDAQDEEQIQVKQQSKMLKEGIKGHIVLKNVSFKYESRQQYVFKNMNVEIKPGQKVAFVGPSGCGKSTIIQLLQRFYIPEEGSITIDGIDIQDFDIHYLRSRFGVVSQEPVLFNASFRENIRYNKHDATEEEIRAAALQANALSFIEGDQKMQGNANVQDNEKETEEKQNAEGKGFDRGVGIKGSHISGGQKQRVAIARAILRNPEILLLDEATSALDAENERKVQESLDRIMACKTTLSIAHRIETITNSDVINVFEKGQIVEKGDYQHLLALKGFFYNLERGTQFV